MQQGAAHTPPNPGMRSTMQKEDRKHNGWNHAKRICGYFSLLQIQANHRKVKRAHSSHSLSEFVSFFLKFLLKCIFFNPLLVHIGKNKIQSWVSGWVAEKFSKCTPRHLRERHCSPPLATVRITVYVPAAFRMLGWDHPVRMVAEIGIQSTTETRAVSFLTCCEG